MVHFFGILQPGLRQSAISAEAPFKTDFFGDGDEPAHPERLCKAERDALLLTGKAELVVDEPDEEAHFVRLATPLYF